jgi:hypothetical protein
MPSKPAATPSATLSAHAARILFLDAQALLDDPGRAAGPVALARLVDRLGFVQLDSINVVDRGHHLTLGARLHGYRPEHLDYLLEARRSLFEHWTHDASAIPTRWYAHWKPRFRRFAGGEAMRRWMTRRMGPEPRKVIAHVKRRLRREGPLRSKDFERETRGRGGFWSWTPEKTALEILWHTGVVAIRGREGFNKVYDLAERVLPDPHRLPAPGRRTQIEWACTTAMERLAVATPREIADFWHAVPAADADAWCRRARRDGRLEAVLVESADGCPPRPAFALADWRARVRGAPPPPDGLRALGPFDPLVRDRKRLARRFGFDYRFEAFVPAPRRTWGYYVLPILEVDRFVARLDPKLHRERGVLEVKHLHWEPGIRPTRARRRALEDALGVIAARVGATRIDLPPAR